MNKSEKTVIVLGAGASVESGIPAQKDFIDVAVSIASDLKDEYKLSSRYSGMLESFRKNYLNVDNIEYLYSAVDMITGFPFLDLSSISNPNEGFIQTFDTRPARYLLDAIRFLIVVTLKSRLQQPWTKGFDAYKRLVKSFTGTIISFNWDNLVEQALSSFGKNMIAYEIDTHKDMKLLKLHGSIDWLFQPADGIFVDATLSEKTIWETDSHEALETPDFEPMLIFPNPSKHSQLDQYGIMHKLWTSAVTSLKTADKIIFVGYSMPHTDIDANVLFQHSISTNQEKPVELIVVNPYIDTNLTERYTALAVTNKNVSLRFERLKFSEFVLSGYFDD